MNIMASHEIKLTFTFDEKRFNADLMKQMALHGASDMDALLVSLMKDVMRYVRIERENVLEDDVLENV